jgi:hypothetical protein
MLLNYASLYGLVGSISVSTYYLYLPFNLSINQWVCSYCSAIISKISFALIFVLTHDHVRNGNYPIDKIHPLNII